MKYKKGTLDQIDGFVLLGFGLNRLANGQISPGKSNLKLAQWVIENNPHQLPTITQMGTYLALKQLEKRDPSLEIDRWAINLPHDDGVHVDTYGAALQIWLICENVGLEKVALVTHPWQSARAYRIFKKLPISDVVMPALPPVPFDRQSIQIWTRRPWLYLLYEFGLARPIGRLFGWL
ncbi:MAG: hypothetical protein AAF490_01390 [Chloroflexota bacterium]